MPRKKKKGKCVFCLKKFSALTTEHVFPAAWYSDTTPQNVQRWTVPSCGSCNQKFSKIEEDMLLRLGMCANPDSYESLGIGKRVLDSVNPDMAKTDKEKKIRQAKRNKLIKQVKPLKDVPPKRVLIDFHPAIILPIGAMNGILIPDNSLKKIAIKIIRGTTYYFHKTYIDTKHEIDIYFSNNPAVSAIKKLITKYGRNEYCGPAIQVGLAYANDDPQSGLFEIIIWGKLRIYANVLPKESEALGHDTAL